MYSAVRRRDGLVWLAHLLKRHKRSAAVPFCPRLFTTGVKRDDYFSVHCLGEKRAAVVWAYQIRDIVTVVAIGLNQGCGNRT